jgi:hypothetical protein
MSTDVISDVIDSALRVRHAHHDRTRAHAVDGTVNLATTERAAPSRPSIYSGSVRAGRVVPREEGPGPQEPMMRRAFPLRRPAAVREAAQVSAPSDALTGGEKRRYGFGASHRKRCWSGLCIYRGCLRRLCLRAVMPAACGQHQGRAQRGTQTAHGQHSSDARHIVLSSLIPAEDAIARLCTSRTGGVDRGPRRRAARD